MTLCIDVEVADLSASRFAVSPITQLTAALMVLSGRIESWTVGPWAGRLRPRLERMCRTDPDVAALVALLQGDGYNADFIAPPPHGAISTFAQDLAAVRDTPAAQARGEIRRVFHGRSRPSEVDRVLRSHDPVGRFASALGAAWEELIAPDWPRMRTILERDLTRRSTRLAADGWEGVLSGMTPMLRWRSTGSGRAIEIPELPAERRRLRGGGILFLPCVFDAMWVCLDEPWHNAITYPADGAAALWQPLISETLPAHTADLIGRSRALVLTAVDGPVTTTQLARALGMALGSVGGHLSVLRRSGLVERSRVGRSVAYRRTPLGDAVLRGVPRRPDGPGD